MSYLVGLSSNWFFECSNSIRRKTQLKQLKLNERLGFFPPIDIFFLNVRAEKLDQLERVMIRLVLIYFFLFAGAADDQSARRLGKRLRPGRFLIPRTQRFGTALAPGRLWNNDQSAPLLSGQGLRRAWRPPAGNAFLWASQTTV